VSRLHIADTGLFVRDRLRTDPGVNAFLASDTDVPPEEMDAGTQRIGYARASNAIMYGIGLVETLTR
jgi:hypothetical protein